MSDEPEEADDSTVDTDSIAVSNSPTGRVPPRCPRCDTPLGLVVSCGPMTHKASPCGCPVSAAVLEENGDGAD